MYMHDSYRYSIIPRRCRAVDEIAEGKVLIYFTKLAAAIGSVLSRHFHRVDVQSVPTLPYTTHGTEQSLLHVLKDGQIIVKAQGKIRVYRRLSCQGDARATTSR